MSSYSSTYSTPWTQLPITPLLGRLPSQLKKMVTVTSATGHLRGTSYNRHRAASSTHAKVMMHAGANISRLPSTVIGRTPRTTPLDRVKKWLYPPMSFNSKWTFQADCSAGRLTALQVPVLNEELARPILNQLRRGMTSDSLTVNPILNQGALTSTVTNNYKVGVENYKCNMLICNSSEHTASLRIVWYRPVQDLDATDDFSTARNDPLNTLMWASQFSTVNTLNVTAPVVGDGWSFDNITVGSDYTANYNHAGATLSGVTTGNNSVNRVALLDPSLLPTHPSVRLHFNKKYRALKTTDIVLQPGHQANADLLIKRRLILNGSDEAATPIRRAHTYFGIIYVMGQMVNSNVAADTTITLGSTQISVIRTDTCTAFPVIAKSKQRVQLTTNNLVILADNLQEVVNEKTDTIDGTFGKAS